MYQYVIKLVIRLLNSPVKSQKLPEYAITGSYMLLTREKLKDTQNIGKLSKRENSVTFKQQLT